MKAEVNVHFVHPEKGVIFRRITPHLPAVGDEIRLADDTFYTVTRRVWAYDEEGPFARINIGVKEAK